MDTTLVIGLVLVLIVGFFAFQWWSAAARKRPIGKPAAAVPPAGVASPMVDPPAVAPANPPAKEERLPAIAGQTAAETLAKEPVQRPVPPTHQEPVTYEGDAPAQFQNNLRRPEQSFHQPQGATAHPTMQISDLPSGRAAAESTPLSGHQQSFGPEYAQNGGALIGNSVFAYDGTVPTDFSAF